MWDEDASGSAVKSRGRAKKGTPPSSHFDPIPPHTIPVGEPRASLISPHESVHLELARAASEVMFGDGASVPAEYARARGVSTLTSMLVCAFTAFRASRVFSASVKGVG